MCADCRGNGAGGKAGEAGPGGNSRGTVGGKADSQGLGTGGGDDPGVGCGVVRHAAQREFWVGKALEGGSCPSPGNIDRHGGAIGTGRTAVGRMGSRVVTRDGLCLDENAPGTDASSARTSPGADKGKSSAPIAEAGRPQRQAGDDIAKGCRSGGRAAD